MKHTVRRGAALLHIALAVLIAVGVFAQVYLIGAYIFGAGADALDAHEGIGYLVHTLEILVFVVALVAWLPRADIGLSFGLLVLGTAQIGLSEADKWAGGLHPLLALFVLILAAVLGRRGLERRRQSPAVA